MRQKKKYIICSIAFVATLSGCIENDIPYPLVDGSITAFEVEGMCDADGNESGTATINKQERTVTVNVDDRVNVAKLRITRLRVTNNARVDVLDTTLYNNPAKFPHKGFASLSDLYVSSDTRVNFSKPVSFRLTTYQEYDWEVTVNQIINRNISIEGQVGNAVIDEVSHNVVVYVSKDKDLSKLHVNEFTLGGQHGKVLPDPTEMDTYDFSKTDTFLVKHAFEELSTEWRVFVYHTESGATLAPATAFPMSTRAYINGAISRGHTLSVEYCKKGASAWTTLDESNIKVTGTKFTATIPHLSPSTEYAWRTLIDGQTATEGQIKTAPAPQLTDADFDNWHQVGRQWNPWSEGGTSFWDTGNAGATTVGSSNSFPTEETCNGQGKAALLESKYIVVKFAAGNIFTGSYKKTDGTNGILDFGRPFTGFPTALRVNYKYKTSTINRCADNDYEYLKGRPDSCQIYIALADWDEPFEIRTRPSNRQLFDPKGKGVIAYAQMTLGDDQPEWTQKDLVLDYYYTDRTPKYILVVASSSKYGDFFTGGDGSKMWVDNFELIYE